MYTSNVDDDYPAHNSIMMYGERLLAKTSGNNNCHLFFALESDVRHFLA